MQSIGVPCHSEVRLRKYSSSHLFQTFQRKISFIFNNEM